MPHYNSGSTVRDAASQNLFRRTHFTAPLHHELKSLEERVDEIGGPEHQRLVKRFAEGPRYVLGGGESAIEIRPVFDIELTSDQNGAEGITWRQPMVGGTFHTVRDVG